MKKRRVFLPLAICLIAMIGLGGVGLAHSLARPHRFIDPHHFVQTNPPPWLFTFDPAHPISGGVPLQQAFAEGAHGQKYEGNEYPIYAVAWLAQGKDNGEAIVQFAKGDSYLNQVYMDVNPSTGDWEAGSSGLLNEALCSGGTVEAPYPYLGHVCGTGFMLGAPDAALGFWTAPVGKVFLIDRLAYTEIRPTDATSITADGSPGWLIAAGMGYTSVVVPLAHGYRLLVASNAGPTRTTAAAGIVMAHLDQLLPLNAPVPQPTPGNPG